MCKKRLTFAISKTNVAMNPIQDYLLNYIKQQLQPHQSLVDVLQEVLGISKDSAYRRLRNNTALTLEEGVKLCLHFHISVDSLLNTETEHVVFQYFRFRSADSFRVYLASIRDRLRQIARLQGKIICADDDLPILHHFQHPEHTAFKMYYWLLSTQPAQAHKPTFSPAWVGKELIELAQEVHEAYCQIPAVEIWTEDCANTTLRQILYCVEVGAFGSPAEARLVCQQFLEMLQSIEKKASEGKALQLYLSEVQIDNNCIWAEAHEKQEVFTRHQSFNIVRTESRLFCEDTHLFLQDLMQKSMLLSGTGEKKRHQLFAYLYQRIEEVIEKLSSKTQ
ncbi:MAG: hypothetical protein EAZ95_04085 [Bacteroidetes bacterium]|nr:MAG: hypothetical protein EAZ95_04085 [Bacteroidota bacterium]